MSALVRFRADPRRVRLSFRRSERGVWVCTIADRARPARYVVAVDRDALVAMQEALELADEAGGYVDLQMGRAYPHPHPHRAHPRPQGER